VIAVSNASSATRSDTQHDVHLQTWIGAIAHRDEQALAQLYETTLSRVYGLALRITRNPQAAEEVCEDVYWQVWREALRFDPQRGNVMAWLLTLTRSRALDHLRRADTAELHEEPELLLQTEAASADDPQDLLAATQNNIRLNQAMQQLDPVQRQLLAMAFFRGLTHEEIATYTDIALGTVKSHIRRALKHLHTLLETDLDKGVES